MLNEVGHRPYKIKKKKVTDDVAMAYEEFD
jgi:hypothetical protein